MMSDERGFTANTSNQAARAARTVALPGVGVDGQRRLESAKIIVIGAGGLGSPVLQYLAAAGVGTIGVVDFDTVDISNLQRQVIHRTADVGMQKTVSAARAIRELDPGVLVVEHTVRLDRTNATGILAAYDLVVDASDNFATRYLVSDVASLQRMPYVWGSVLQFDGQLSVFWEGAPDGSSVDYRDLHPVPPNPADILSCAEGGVLGSLCGTIGSMMATEALKIVIGVGVPMVGRVQNLDALTGEWRSFAVRRSPTRVPVSELMDYEEFCGAPVAAESRDGSAADEISVDELRTLLAGGASLLDVREPDEHAAGHIPGDRLVSLGALLDDPGLAGVGPVVAYCASGVRSARAAQLLVSRGVAAVSLRGGYAAWLQAEA